jgi:hypothetical protein
LQKRAGLGITENSQNGGQQGTASTGAGEAPVPTSGGRKGAVE